MLEQSSNIFYEGEAGWFRQVDLKHVGDTSALIPFESDLEGLGFQPLGDFVCSAMVELVDRVWVNHKEKVQAIILVRVQNSSLNILAVFFGSHFADGTRVMTTATPALASKETKTYYRKVCDWSNTYNLFHDHKSYLASLSVKHGPPKPIAESLLSVMESIDKATIDQDY